MSEALHAQVAGGRYLRRHGDFGNLENIVSFCTLTALVQVPGGRRLRCHGGFGNFENDVSFCTMTALVQVSRVDDVVVVMETL